MLRPEIRKYVPLDERVYIGYLMSAEERSGANGPFYSLRFGIPQEDGPDRTILASCANYIGKDNKTRQIYKALMNRDVVAGEDTDLDRLLGRRCQLVVKHVVLDGQVYDRPTEFLAISGQKPLPVVMLEQEAEESGEEEDDDIPF